MRSPKSPGRQPDRDAFALAIALSYLESLVSPLLGLMPAIKLGLSNIVVMYALLFLRTRTALLLDCVKALFAFADPRGHRRVCCRCAAGRCLWPSCLCCCICRSAGISSVPVRRWPTTWGSGRGRRLLSSAMALGYAPVLLAAGLIVGGISCILSRALFAALPKQAGQQRRGSPFLKIRIFLKIFILPIDIYAYMPYNKAIDTGMCPRSNYKITGGNSYD